MVAARRELPERGAGAPRAAAPLPEHGGAAARVRARERGSECARPGGRRREPGGVGAGRGAPSPGPRVGSFAARASRAPAFSDPRAAGFLELVRG